MEARASEGTRRTGVGTREMTRETGESRDTTRRLKSTEISTARGTPSLPGTAQKLTEGEETRRKAMVEEGGSEDGGEK